jgi:glutaredoxin
MEPLVEYTIYGTQGCYECQQAKKLLDAKGIPYSYMDAPSSLFFQREFVDKGIRKVPQIFISETSGERYVGGYPELIKEVM